MSKARMVHVLGVFVGLTALRCRELPQAPNPPAPLPELPYAMLRVDRLEYYADVVPGWGFPQILLEQDQSVHIISMDWWDNRLRYAGCASNCDDVAYWFTGTADSASVNSDSYFEAMGAVLGADGFHVVYHEVRGGQPVIRYAQCPGACNFSRNWQQASLFSPARISSQFGDHSVPLAEDPSGTLHLFYARQDSLAGFWHGQCASGCLSSGNWQSVMIDSLIPSTWVVVAGPAGDVHLLMSDGPVLRYARCSGDCLNSASWQSAVVDSGGGHFVDALALGSDGVLHGAFLADANAVHYVECQSNCTGTGNWKSIAPGTTSTDLAIATDRTGHQVSLVTDWAHVVVMRCGNACLTSTSWIRTDVDSGAAYSYLSVAVDSAGRERLGSSFFGLQYARLRQ